MSRISRYQGSVKRFINERSCLIDIKGSDIEDIIKNDLLDENYILPILMLTIMNAQNKKNHNSFQGYYAASSVEFLRIFFELNIKRKLYIEKYGLDKYFRLVNLMLLWSMKSWNQNIEAIKRHLSENKMNKLYSQYINLLNDKVGINGILSDCLVESNNKIKSDLHRCYFNHKDKQLKDKFLNTQQIKTTVMDTILENKMGSLCELIVSVGWFLGCGEDSKYNRLLKAGKNFGIMYQISNDFDKIDQDLEGCVDKVTLNYVINCGIQDSYEKFMTSKQVFIEEALNLDIFSNTVKEMVDIIEEKINNVIDNTSPDIKSTYSTLV